jgi:hypothetical protein
MIGVEWEKGRGTMKSGGLTNFVTAAAKRANPDKYAKHNNACKQGNSWRSLQKASLLQEYT